MGDMSELQDAIDRFALALPLLDSSGEGAAQYRDDAQAIVEAARKYANPDYEAAIQVEANMRSGVGVGPLTDRSRVQAIVDAALDVTEDE